MTNKYFKYAFSLMAGICLSFPVMAQGPKTPTPESIQLSVLTNMADTLDICGVSTVARRKLDYAINYYGHAQKQYTEAEYSQIRSKTKSFLANNQSTICQPYASMAPQDIAEVVDALVGQGPQNNGENFTR